MQSGNLCGVGQAPDCSEFHLCEIRRADESCLTTTPNPDTFGWCYVDPDSGVGDPSLVSDCPVGSRWALRFVGNDTPLPDAVTMIACGQAI
jgi:hypothetical protein